MRNSCFECSDLAKNNTQTILPFSSCSGDMIIANRSPKDQLKLKSQICHRWEVSQWKLVNSNIYIRTSADEDHLMRLKAPQQLINHQLPFLTILQRWRNLNLFLISKQPNTVSMVRVLFCNLPVPSKLLLILHQCTQPSHHHMSAVNISANLRSVQGWHLYQTWYILFKWNAH